MNILVTGSNGFLGKNLISKLDTLSDYNIFKFDVNDSKDKLEEYVLKADIIFHLAGVNRPKNIDEFYIGNTELTEEIIGILIAANKDTPVVMSSSIQVELGNDYGESKRMAEEILFKYRNESKAKVVIYRLPNIFGKWSRPNYNSVIATFCYNISRDKDIWISDENKSINLVYIDDVVNDMISNLKVGNIKSGYRKVRTEYKKTLGEISDLIKSFKNSRENLLVPNMEDEFSKKLYSTYLSFLSEDNFKYDLKMNIDNRGSFTEVLKTEDRGQFSINVSKPGIIKGNHWHNTKVEKFIVVKGRGVIKLRKLHSDKVIKYEVSDRKYEVIDIPVGYTHSIENVGDEDMVTIMWANENYDNKRPDTIYLEVEK